jgi:hypothetical protein
VYWGINTEKAKRVLLSCRLNAGQNHDIKITNRLFEDVTVQNLIQDEIKRRLNSGNACCPSV